MNANAIANVMAPTGVPPSGWSSCIATTTSPMKKPPYIARGNDSERTARYAHTHPMSASAMNAANAMNPLR